MKVLVVGLGETGMMLAERLSEENHEVSVIDTDHRLIERATERLNVNGVVGSGASRSILMQAGAETADVLIAMTPMDEMNIFSCITAKKCGTRFVCARVSKAEFEEDREYVSREYGIDALLNAEKETAVEIQKHIALPGALHADAFFSNKVMMVALEAGEGSPLVNLSMQEVRQFFQTELLVATVTNGTRLIIPDGSYHILPGDVLRVIFSTNPDVVRDIFHKLHVKEKPAHNVLMIGCRTTGYYLAERLYGKYALKILESDRERCVELVKRFPKAQVICGDAIDTQVLKEEGAGKADVCVALTGDDRTNLAVSMYAWSHGVGQVIAKLNEMSYGQLLRKSNIDVAICPSAVMLEKVLSIVRNLSSGDHSKIRRLYRIADGMAEVIEFEVSKGLRNLDIPFADERFNTKKGVLVAAIIRDGQVIIPNGSSRILVGDLVVIVADRKNRINDLEDIFGKK